MDSSSSPRFVGEVRCATMPRGCSWKWSGGSQWSSGPTSRSKYSQVRRAIRRSCWRCPMDSGCCLGAIGLLIHSATSGEASQASRSGAAAGSAGKLLNPISAANPTAIAGAPPICFHRRVSLVSLPNRRIVCAAVVHCRSRLWLMVRRTSVVPIASTISRAS